MTKLKNGYQKLSGIRFCVQRPSIYRKQNFSSCAVALVDVRVRQHDFCEWINGLDALGASNRTAGNFFGFGYKCNIQVRK